MVEKSRLKFLPKWVDEIVIPKAPTLGLVFRDEKLVGSRGGSGEVYVRAGEGDA